MAGLKEISISLKTILRTQIHSVAMGQILSNSLGGLKDLQLRLYFYQEFNTNRV